MQYLCRIKSIRERAERVKLPIAQLCDAGGIDPSTLHRWEQPAANPRLRSMNMALDRMEARLAELEKALVTAIASENPDIVAEALEHLADMPKEAAE